MRRDSGCSTADLATWVRCCTFSQLARHSAFSLCSPVECVPRALTVSVTHSDNVSAETGCLKETPERAETSCWPVSDSGLTLSTSLVPVTCYHTALMTSYLSVQQTTRQETCAIRWELWFNSTKLSLSISPCHFLYCYLFTALYKNGGFKLNLQPVCVSITPMFMQGTHTLSHTQSLVPKWPAVTELQSHSCILLPAHWPRNPISPIIHLRVCVRALMAFSVCVCVCLECRC